MLRGQRLRWYCGLLGVLVWPFVIYANALTASFQFDDIWNIVENPASHVTTLSPSALLDAVANGVYPSRPVATFTFALNHWWGGLDPWGYHLVNVLIHALTALGLAVAARLLLNAAPLRERYGRQSQGVALVAAAIFVCHPINVQAVTYVVQRMASLAALFGVWSVASLLLAARERGARRAAGMLGAALLLALALGSKETAVVFPLFVLLAVVAIWRWPESRRRRLGVILGGPVVLALGIALVFGVGRVWTLGWSALTGERFGQLLTVPRGVVIEWSLFLAPLPSRLSLEHYVPFSSGLLTPPSTLLALVVVGAAIVAGAWLCRSRPLLGILLLWGTVPLVIENAAVRHDPVMEHRLYLPVLGLSLLLALGYAAVSQRAPRAALVALFALLAAGSLGTYERNRVWATPVSLAEDSAEKAPEKVRATSNLVILLSQSGRGEEAGRYYIEHVRSQPITFDRDLFAKANAAMAVGYHHDAVSYLELFLSRSPQLCGDPRIQLALAHFELGQLEAAIASLHALERCSRLLPGEVQRAAALRARIDGALEVRASRNPADVRTRLSQASILLSQGQPAAAAAAFEVILADAPGNPVALSNLGFCHWDLGDFERAAALQRQAIAGAPRMATAHYGLGQALASLGERAAARASFERYLELAPPQDMFRAAAQQHLAELGEP